MVMELKRGPEYDPTEARRGGQTTVDPWVKAKRGQARLPDLRGYVTARHPTMKVFQCKDYSSTLVSSR